MQFSDSLLQVVSLIGADQDVVAGVELVLGWQHLVPWRIPKDYVEAPPLRSEQNLGEFQLPVEKALSFPDRLKLAPPASRSGVFAQTLWPRKVACQC